MRKIMVLALAAALVLCFMVPALAQQGQKNIMLTAISTGKLNGFTQAANITHYDTSFYTGGPYTVFAPTDDAFGKVPAGTVSSWMANRPLLTTILKNHVITGTYTADQLVKMGTVSTLAGKQLKFTRASNGSTFVNDARVVMPDVRASNGIIQEVDSVLVPLLRQGTSILFYVSYKRSRRPP